MDLLVCTTIEQSWPTFKNILKENLNMNRFICTGIHNGRKEKEKKCYELFFYKASLLACIVFGILFLK